MESQPLVKNDSLCELEQLNKLKLIIQQNSDFEKFIEFFDDHTLLNFLKRKNNDHMKAYATLGDYIKVRTEKYPDFFRSLRPSTTSSLKCGFFRILKHPDQFNQAVAISHTRKWDPSKDSPEDCIKAYLMFGEQYMMSPKYKDRVNNGFVVIFDVAQQSFQHIKATTPSVILKGIAICCSIPVQYKAIHIVNETSVFRVLLKAVSPIFPKKLRQRLHIHGSNLTSLHKHVSPLILPESLGGMLPEEDAFDTEFEKHILQRESYYEKFAQKL